MNIESGTRAVAGRSSQRSWQRPAVQSQFWSAVAFVADMEGYNATEVTIEDAGLDSQGMARRKSGEGRGELPAPGHLLVHNISASMSHRRPRPRTGWDGEPLLDARPRTHPFLSLGPSGRFSLPEASIKNPACGCCQTGSALSMSVHDAWGCYAG
ncbi:hypothetical protein KCP74_25100 [Salmonella enterica subsp. enterica]|nr:hypothetical protein KCP74_25100 [Salmonella enterica subsp. enterica]